jgi:lipid II:glycine glycyltransferase (peptidoglycan interpeptide bridge formation enzyme)
MKVQWDGHDMATWDQAHAQAAGALQQDWAYGSTRVAMGSSVLRAVVHADGAPVAMAQFIVRRFGRWAGFALCSRGPIWLQALSGSDKAQSYKAMRQSIPLPGLRFLMITPDEPQSPALGLPHLRRIMTGYATVMLDISQPMDALRTNLDPRWRSPLSGAEKSELSIHRMGTNPGQYRWLLDADMQQRVTRGFQGYPDIFFERYAESRKQPSKNILSIRADLGRDRVAAMMFMLHGEAATYQVGWTSDAGRSLHAHHLILWKGIEELKERGIRQLDLGGVNTGRSAGIARFKMATGGVVKVLAGSYLL